MIIVGSELDLAPVIIIIGGRGYNMINGKPSLMSEFTDSALIELMERMDRRGFGCRATVIACELKRRNAQNRAVTAEETQS
jgi:hypothetical protein